MRFISSLRVIVSGFSGLPDACHLHSSGYRSLADSRTLTTHFMSFQFMTVKTGETDQ